MTLSLLTKSKLRIWFWSNISAPNHLIPHWYLVMWMSVWVTILKLFAHLFLQELLAAVDDRPWNRLAKRRVQHYGYEFCYDVSSSLLTQPISILCFPFLPHGFSKCQNLIFLHCSWWWDILSFRFKIGLGGFVWYVVGYLVSLPTICLPIIILLRNLELSSWCPSKGEYSIDSRYKLSWILLRVDFDCVLVMLLGRVI